MLESSLSETTHSPHNVLFHVERVNGNITRTVICTQTHEDIYTTNQAYCNNIYQLHIKGKLFHNVKLVNYLEQLSCYTHYLVLMNVVYSSFINTLTGREALFVDDTLLPSLSGSTHRDNVIGAATTEMVLVRACTTTISTLQGKGSKRLRDQTI